MPLRFSAPEDWLALGDDHRLDQLASASSRHITASVIRTIALVALNVRSWLFSPVPANPLERPESGSNRTLKLVSTALGFRAQPLEDSARQRQKANLIRIGVSVIMRELDGLGLPPGLFQEQKSRPPPAAPGDGPTDRHSPGPAR